jgi:hypothetical protein
MLDENKEQRTEYQSTDASECTGGLPNTRSQDLVPGSRYVRIFIITFSSNHGSRTFQRTGD